MHHRQKAENRSGFRKKRKKEPTRLIMFRFLKNNLKGQKRSRRRRRRAAQFLMGPNQISVLARPAHKHRHTQLREESRD